MSNLMTKNLGVVSPVPKGDYNSEVYYEKLNIVKYNNSTYIAKQPSQGIVPTNTEYWQLLVNVGTKLEITYDEISNPENNTEYEKIIDEQEITGVIRKSNFELYYDAMQTSELNAENGKIRVGTFNIQNQNVPYNIGIRGYDKLNKLKRIYTALKCDILGLNETLAGGLCTPETAYLNEFYKYFTQVITSYNTRPQLNYGPSIISKNNYISTDNARYERSGPNEKRGYVKNVYSIGGKTLSFYCTHFDYIASTLPHQVSELFSIVENDTSDYVIIVGDFNFNLATESTNYLSDFISAGFKQVNGGNYITFPSSNSKLDEILVSPNIDIVSSGIFTQQEIGSLSDHLPLWAELELK